MLLLLASREKLHKPNELLQNKLFFYSRIVTPFNFFSGKSRNSKKFDHSHLKMTLGFAIRGSIGVTALKFINTFRTLENWSSIFIVKKNELRVQSRKLYGNKYMTASTQITNTEIFASIAVLVLLSHKVLPINRKQ